MNRLNDHDHEKKHVRSIALKVVGHRDGQESSEDSDEETFNLLTIKFSKFLNKNNNKNQSSNDFNSNNYTYFGCGKQDHIKVDCPNNETKEREASKKFEKKGKAKRAYIAWQDNDVSSSN